MYIKRLYYYYDCNCDDCGIAPSISANPLLFETQEETLASVEVENVASVAV